MNSLPVVLFIMHHVALIGGQVRLSDISVSYEHAAIIDATADNNFIGVYCNGGSLDIPSSSVMTVDRWSTAYIDNHCALGQESTFAIGIQSYVVMA